MIDNIDIEELLKNSPAFCYQCEQTSEEGCKGRNVDGVFGRCGKDTEVAMLIDFMCDQNRRFANLVVAKNLQDKFTDQELRLIFLQPNFMSITNANFDPTMLSARVDMINEICSSRLGVEFARPNDLQSLKAYGHEHGVLNRLKTKGKTVGGLLECVVYAIRGACAYAEHTAITDDGNLDRVREPIWNMVEAISKFDETTEAGPALQLIKDVGKCNLEIMAALDAATEERFDVPSFGTLKTHPRPGPAILVSGHDYVDLRSLLETIKQRGLNISVYTHGEMLPAHGHACLREYDELAGNLGSSWANQRLEFRKYDKACVLFTTNCIIKPFADVLESKRIFTTRIVGMPGCQHLSHGEWDPIIDRAIELGGFTQEECDAYAQEEKEKGFQDLLSGGGWKQVLAHADKILELIKEGKITRFLFCGGCDANSKGRDYFSQLVRFAPKSWVILTSGCGRFRVHRAIPEGFGDIEGIPRMIDCGQCNDSYSAVKIGLELAKALGCELNDLPLSLSVQWFEQKAVAIFATLVYLGKTNMFVGPSLPRFFTQDAINVLVDLLNVHPHSTVEEDLAVMSRDE